MKKVTVGGEVITLHKVIFFYVSLAFLWAKFD